MNKERKDAPQESVEDLARKQDEMLRKLLIASQEKSRIAVPDHIEDADQFWEWIQSFK